MIDKLKKRWAALSPAEKGMVAAAAALLLAIAVSWRRVVAGAAHGFATWFGG